MTLINAVYTPTGIIMSGDSRTTGNGFVVSDATNKVFFLFNRIGITTAGNAFLNLMPIEHYIREFELNNFEEGFELTVLAISQRLLHFFEEVSPDMGVYLMVSGYDDHVPYLYDMDTFGGNGVQRLNIDDNGKIQYGAFWNGDTEIVSRLAIGGLTPLFVAMNIQDAIDYSRHLIRTTIDQLRFEPRFPTVGGEIDTLLIIPEGGNFVCKKGLTYKT